MYGTLVSSSVAKGGDICLCEICRDMVAGLGVEVISVVCLLQYPCLETVVG